MKAQQPAGLRNDATVKIAAIGAKSVHFLNE